MEGENVNMLISHAYNYTLVKLKMNLKEWNGQYVRDIPWEEFMKLLWHKKAFPSYAYLKPRRLHTKLKEIRETWHPELPVYVR